MRAFWAAVSAVKGGSGGRLMATFLKWRFWRGNSGLPEIIDDRMIGINPLRGSSAAQLDISYRKVQNEPSQSFRSEFASTSLHFAPFRTIQISMSSTALAAL